jgi:hypothetical protein
MNFGFKHLFQKETLTVYKIWLENDGKPLPAEYGQCLDQRIPKGSRAVLWSSRAETNQLLAKYKDQFPGIYDLYWAPNTRPVSRSDILRLMLVYDRPCIYSDHDIFWRKKRLASSSHDIVFWTEFVHSDEAVRKNMAFTRIYRGDVPEYNVRIANYVYWSRKPHSAIVGRCLRHIQERLGRLSGAPMTDYGILYATAGDVITDTVVEGLPDPAILKPFEKCERRNLEWIDRDGESVLLLGRQPGQAIARHEIHGQWRTADG